MSIGRHLYQRFKLSLACLSDWGISGGGVCCLGNVLSHSLQTLPPEIHTLRLSGGCCQWYTGIKCLLVFLFQFGWKWIIFLCPLHLVCVVHALAGGIGMTFTDNSYTLVWPVFLCDSIKNKLLRIIKTTAF